MYCIIDVETTGGNPRFSKITELAIYKYDGRRIIDEFVTLINPEVGIPEYISQLTGIADKMVRNAPKFYEVAGRIVKMTQGAIFVAHNVAFDFACIHSEFAALGYEFHLPQVCTVRLARAIIPGHRSYSLGNLCSDLNIKIDGRHRAGGDALATVQLFEILLQKNHGVLNIQNPYQSFNLSLYHADLDFDSIKLIPESDGIYYFKDASDELLYVGHGSNLRQFVIDHLSRTKSQRSLKLLQLIAKIDFEITGSLLIAELITASVISSAKPRFNHLPQKITGSFGIYKYIDQRGYCRFKIGKIDKKSDVIARFASQEEATQALTQWMEAYLLCAKMCGLDDNNTDCFQYHQNQCSGACVGEELPEIYNVKAESFLQDLDFKYTQRVIIDKGRRDSEVSLVYIGQSNEIGWGYMMQDEITDDNIDFKSRVILQPNSSVLKPVLTHYFESCPNCHKIISLK